MIRWFARKVMPLYSGHNDDFPLFSKTMAKVVESDEVCRESYQKQQEIQQMLSSYQPTSGTTPSLFEGCWQKIQEEEYAKMSLQNTPSIWYRMRLPMGVAAIAFLLMLFNLPTNSFFQYDPSNLPTSANPNFVVQPVKDTPSLMNVRENELREYKLEEVKPIDEQKEQDI